MWNTGSGTEKGCASFDCFFKFIYVLEVILISEIFLERCGFPEPTWMDR